MRRWACRDATQRVLASAGMDVASMMSPRGMPIRVQRRRGSCRRAWSSTPAMPHPVLQRSGVGRGGGGGRTGGDGVRRRAQEAGRVEGGGKVRVAGLCARVRDRRDGELLAEVHLLGGARDGDVAVIEAVPPGALLRDLKLDMCPMLLAERTELGAALFDEVKVDDAPRHLHARSPAQGAARGSRHPAHLWWSRNSADIRV